MKNSKNSGQAIIEFLTLLLAFCICFLGLILVMGISITNLEVFNTAKFEADEKAYLAETGRDGINIKSWIYTNFPFIQQDIPFLPDDRPTASTRDLDSFEMQFNNKTYSDPKDRYVFNDFKQTNFKIADNFTENISGLSYFETANLLRGRAFIPQNEERVLTINDPQYFDRQKTYAAIRKILGIEIKKLNLEDNHSNTVYMPAMKILDK
ncbi:MAG: hypothetical protein IKA22_12210 [Lentisphaeria bacterium]|nr:hypothetical protein [Lentisphaeria bacterium]